jgi:aminoglycoside phosphotransferase (APT) family kinase protein
VPPWTPSVVRGVARAYAAFHLTTLGRTDLPDWLPRPPKTLARVTWSRVVEASEGLRAVAALAGDQRDAAYGWLRAALPLLSRLADSAGETPGPYALLHGDTRSDNLRFRAGRLRLFDWPSVEVGRPEFDLAAFAQTVTAEGGVEPEQVIAWYGERLALRAQVMDAAVAWLAAYFANLAWRPEMPGFPRLRQFQRRQLVVTLRWAARRLRLAEPAWVGALR